MLEIYKEYSEYQERYIKRKRFVGLAPLMTKRNRDMEGKEVIVHNYDQICSSPNLNQKHASIIRRTTITLNNLYLQKRDAVHRFVISNGLVYLDPWFTGARESPLFNKCVWIDPGGLSIVQHNLAGKLVIRLGGYVTKDMKFFTSVIAKKWSETSEEENEGHGYISLECLLDHYRDIYKRDFNLF